MKLPSVLLIAALSGLSFAPPIPASITSEFEALRRLETQRGDIISKAVTAEGEEWDKLAAEEMKLARRGIQDCEKLRKLILEDIDIEKADRPSTQFSVIKLTHMLAATNAFSDQCYMSATGMSNGEADPQPKDYEAWSDAQTQQMFSHMRAWDAATEAYDLCP